MSDLTADMEKNFTILTLVEFFIDAFDSDQAVVSFWFSHQSSEWDAKGFYGDLKWLLSREYSEEAYVAGLNSQMSSDSISLVGQFFLDAWAGDRKAHVWDWLERREIDLSSFYEKVLALRSLTSDEVADSQITEEQLWREGPEA